MALRNYWDAAHHLLVVRHIGFLRPTQVEEFHQSLFNILASTYVNLVLDLREAMYTNKHIQFAFDPAVLRQSVGHHNVACVLVIVPEKHPLREFVMESCLVANVLYKVKFFRNWDDAIYSLDSNSDNYYNLSFSA